VFGAGSFDHGRERNRFAVLFAGNSRLVSDFRNPWVRLQGESRADMDNPKEMLMGAPLAAIGCDFKSKPVEGAPLDPKLFRGKLSKKIAEEVEDTKARQFGADMRAPPEDSRVRQAYIVCDEYSGACLGCIPTWRDNIRGAEWRGIICILLGVPNPLFRTFIGTPMRMKNGKVRKK
jgi:hypothetical protein